MLNKELLSDPGYTPSRRDLGEVLVWLLDGDEATAKAAERALVSVGPDVIEPVVLCLDSAAAPQRIRCARLLGRLAQRSSDPRLGAVLLRLLSDVEPRVARSATVAVGKLPVEHAAAFGVESALIAQLPRAAEPERRAIVEALGKIGSAAAAETLSQLTQLQGHEAELVTRAKLRLGRASTTYVEQDRVLLERPLPFAWNVVVFHRRGLSDIVGRQLAPSVDSIPDGPERRKLCGYRGALAELFQSRSLLVPALVLEFERPAHATDWASAVADAICHSEVIATLEQLSSTRPRLRFVAPHEGHQRALLWQISEALSLRTDRLQANPKAALWEVQIDRAARPRMYLVPRRFEDPRFGYRVRDISGASHPTIAAALAHVLDVRPGDVIWDPFVGSGLELIECSIGRQYQELIGTDNNSRSLEAAQANIGAAKTERIRLLNADARTATLPGVTGIVTNPPLGIRHHRDGQLATLLPDFLTNARRVLRPRGRLVWLSPLPSDTARHGRNLGFQVTRVGNIDVGGLSPELQIMRLS